MQVVRQKSQAQTSAAKTRHSPDTVSAQICARSFSRCAVFWPHFSPVFCSVRMLTPAWFPQTARDRTQPQALPAIALLPVHRTKAHELRTLPEKNAALTPVGPSSVLTSRTCTAVPWTLRKNNSLRQITRVQPKLLKKNGQGASLKASANDVITNGFGFLGPGALAEDTMAMPLTACVSRTKETIRACFAPNQLSKNTLRDLVLPDKHRPLKSCLAGTTLPVIPRGRRDAENCEGQASQSKGPQTHKLCQKGWPWSHEVCKTQAKHTVGTGTWWCRKPRDPGQPRSSQPPA